MDKTKKVGVILIATGAEYHNYIIPQIESIKENFNPSDDVTVFLFTDAKHKYVDKQFYLKDVGFPGATLWRYTSILKQENELKKMDYLYYMDVDMLVVGKVGKEILSDLVATLHPGFTNIRGTYEHRQSSSAYVANNEGEYYFCGGFNGGSSEKYLKMAKKLSKDIETDHSHGVMAIWHDESHINRYLIDNPPTKILSPSYCYPEPPDDKKYETKLWKKQYVPKIYALSKNQRIDKVSIIIPCYKQAQFLHNAIESALRQTYANIEIIVVNDGSPDNTSEVAKKYPVTLIEQKNKGLSAARNTGIAKATGEYFLPLDSDDTIDKDYLMKTVPKMTDPRVGVVYTSMQTMDTKYKFKRICKPAPTVSVESFKITNQIYICSLVRMEIIRECNGYNTNMIHGYEDWDLWINIIKRGWNFKFVSAPLFRYMLKPSSMGVVSFRDWHKWNINQIEKNHPSVFKDNPTDSELVNEYKKQSTATKTHTEKLNMNHDVTFLTPHAADEILFDIFKESVKRHTPAKILTITKEETRHWGEAFKWLYNNCPTNIAVFIDDDAFILRDISPLIDSVRKGKYSMVGFTYKTEEHVKHNYFQPNFLIVNLKKFKEEFGEDAMFTDEELADKELGPGGSSIPMYGISQKLRHKKNKVLDFIISDNYKFANVLWDRNIPYVLHLWYGAWRHRRSPEGDMSERDKTVSDDFWNDELKI